MIRITKNINNHLEKRKDINSTNKQDVFLSILTIRKELLSDLLEFEDYFTNMLTKNLGIMKISYINLELFKEKKFLKMYNPNNEIKPIIEKEVRNVNDLYSILSDKKIKLGKNKKIHHYFESMSLGSKIHFLNTIDMSSLELATKELLNIFQKTINIQKLIPEIKEEITNKKIENYFLPYLVFIRDFRNYLSHKLPHINSDSTIDKIYNWTPRKKHLSKKHFVSFLKETLLLIHEDIFDVRIIEKLKNNPKINFKNIENNFIKNNKFNF